MAAARRDGSVRLQPYGARPGAALDKVRCKYTCCKYTHTYTHITKHTNTQTHTLQKPNTHTFQTTPTHIHTHYKPTHTHTPIHYETISNNHSTWYTPNKIVTIQSIALNIRSPSLYTVLCPQEILLSKFTCIDFCIYYLVINMISSDQ